MSVRGTIFFFLSFLYLSCIHPTCRYLTCIHFINTGLVIVLLHLSYHCSVFEGGPIPYPKREYLSDDDNEDKSSSKSATGGANSTHGQPPAKRVRVLPPSTSSGTMNMNTYVSTSHVRLCHLWDQ